MFLGLPLDCQVGLHRIDQVLLRRVLPLQRRKHILVYRILRYDVVNGYHFFLPLPPQAGIAALAGEIRAIGIFPAFQSAIS